MKQLRFFMHTRKARVPETTLLVVDTQFTARRALAWRYIVENGVVYGDALPGGMAVALLTVTTKLLRDGIAWACAHDVRRTGVVTLDSYHKEVNLTELKQCSG